MRTSGFAASTPDCPPSPPTDSIHTGDPENCQVPLSWVPPITSPVGSNGLMDRLWNWMVPRFSFSV